MATEVNSNIRATGGDYATISLWEASLGNIVTADEQHNGLLFDEQYGENNLVFSGTTTDATRYPVLKPASGEQNDFRIEGSGPRFKHPSADDATTNLVFEILDSFYRIENFEILGNSLGFGYNDPTALINATGSGGTGLHIVGMMLHFPPKTTVTRAAGIDVAGLDGGLITGNMIYDLVTTGSSSRGLQTAGSTNAVGTSYITNNSLFNGNDRGLTTTGNPGTASMVVKNNIVLTFTGDCYRYFAGTGSTITSDDNMSSDITADDNGDGTHFLSESAAAIYVNIVAGTEDLHLKIGTNAIDGGGDLGTTPAGIEFDIDGYNRDAGVVIWDIGADQQGLDVSDNPAVGDINLNPAGSGLSNVNSGTPTLSIGGDLSVSPTGSSLQLIESNDVATLEADVNLSPTGSPLQDIDSGIHALQIDTDVSPEGSSLAVVGSGNPTIQNAPGGTLLNPEGSSLAILESEIPAIQIINDLPFTEVNPIGSTLNALGSGAPTFAISGDIFVNPVGSELDKIISHQPTFTGSTSPVGAGFRIKILARVIVEKHN